MIAIIWSVSSIMAVSPHIFGLSFDDNNKERCQLTDNLTYQLVSTLAAFYLPLIVMCIIYWKIFQSAKLRIRKKAFKGSSVMSKSNNNSQKPKKSNKKQTSQLTPFNGKQNERTIDLNLSKQKFDDLSLKLTQESSILENSSNLTSHVLVNQNADGKTKDLDQFSSMSESISTGNIMEVKAKNELMNRKSMTPSSSSKQFKNLIQMNKSILKSIVSFKKKQDEPSPTQTGHHKESIPLSSRKNKSLSGERMKNDFSQGNYNTDVKINYELISSEENASSSQNSINKKVKMNAVA